MTPESPSALSPLVRRVVANNPGLMTGPGTNTYLIGIDEVAVIDPGPDDARHVEAIVGASMRERVRWVLLTHTHPDHWPAAARIREQTGAEVAAFGKDPKAVLDEYVAHRKMRERQILKALQAGPAKISELVERLYIDTPEGLQEMAARQVHAHLLKLKSEGKVEGTGVRSAWKIA